jgi:ribosome-associated toxin RatA of RatAB toxin-antitoxin module
MRKVIRTALVPYSAAQMFELVKDVEAYPSFLPWCNDAELHVDEEDFIEASLELHRGRISKRFRTRNPLRVNEFLGIELVGGPFRHLQGGWSFEQ